MAKGKPAPGPNKEMGLTKQEILDRVDRIANELKPPTRGPFEWVRGVFRSVANLLLDLGVPYPLALIISSPVRDNWHRGGMIYMAPSEVVDISFCARRSGILVFDEISLIPVNPVASWFIDVKYFFDSIQNSIDMSCDKTKEKVGFAYRKRTIRDQRSMTIRITNTSPCAMAIVCVRISGWEL